MKLPRSVRVALAYWFPGDRATRERHLKKHRRRLEPAGAFEVIGEIVQKRIHEETERFCRETSKHPDIVLIPRIYFHGFLRWTEDRASFSFDPGDSKGRSPVTMTYNGALIGWHDQDDSYVTHKGSVINVICGATQ